MFLLVANLFVRSALILGAAILLCRASNRLRPKQRHAILASAFALLLLWPLFAALLPEIALPLWKTTLSREIITIQQVARVRGGPVANHFQFSPALLWFIVTLAVLAPLLTAHLRLRSLVRRAVLCEDADWNDLLYELCARLGLADAPQLLIYPRSLMPMVAGVLRPCIVLPSDCRQWTQTRRRMVLLHEIGHIVRRDLLTQSCARLIAAAWWFQPLAWIALSMLRRESERACDEFVVQSGVRPSDYAAELLTIAHSFTCSSKGLAMARTAGLEGRLRSILQPQKIPSPKIAVVAICSLTALTITASAVTIQPRGHTMKHTLFAGLLASAGLTAATIGGSLYDPSGAAVPNAKALLYDPDTNTKFETTTAADGKFSFEALPAGQYILRVQSPGFATLFREFNVKTDSKVDRGLTLALGKAQEQITVSAEGTPMAAAANESKRIRVGGNVEQMNLVTKVQPIYPKAAKMAGVQGVVLLETVISKEGEPLDIRVISSPNDDLTQSSLEAVRQWRYRPTLLNGNPVEIVTDVNVNYTLMK